MKKNSRFWTSAGKYLLQRLWILGVFLGAMMLVTSIDCAKISMTGARTTREAIEMAAAAGDYPLAQQLLKNTANSKVLGAESELEEMADPTARVQREIRSWEETADKYPGSRDIYLNLEKLYRESGDEETAAQYWEQARKLDPNNEMFR